MDYYPYDTISNVAIAVFDDGANVPVKQLEIAIDPVQDLHGQDYPYPAGGGKNKFNKDDSNVTASNYINLSGGTSPSGDYFATDYIPVDENIDTDMVVSGFTKGYVAGSVGMACYDSSKEFIRASSTPTIDITGASYIRLSVAYVDADTFMLEYGSTATEYAPYANVCPITGWTGCDITVQDAESDPTERNVYDVDWTDDAGTVYGGALEYEGNGKYLLTKNFATYDLGSIVWTKHSSGFFYADISPMKVGQDSMLCTQYGFGGYKTDAQMATAEDFMFYRGGSTSKAIKIKDSRYADYTTNEFKTAVTGVKLYYPLATPQTYEITADAVETLYRNNVIFANTGDIITLEYRLNQFDYYRRYFMKNPGYYLLDGGGIDLSTSESQTITGAWNRAVTAIKTGKPIWAFNTKYGSGKNLTPVPVFAWYISASAIVIVGATLHIQVAPDDSCVVQDVAPQANRAFMQKIDGLIPEDDVDEDDLNGAPEEALEDPEEAPEEGDEK